MRSGHLKSKSSPGESNMQSGFTGSETASYDRRTFFLSSAQQPGSRLLGSIQAGGNWLGLGRRSRKMSQSPVEGYAQRLISLHRCEGESSPVMAGFLAWTRSA